MRKTLRDDVQAVFYVGNRFVVYDDGQSIARNITVAVSRFLRSVVTAAALRHLRFLELVFPPDAWLRQGDDALVLQAWIDIVKWAREMVNVAVLTIRVVAAFDNELETARAVTGERLANTGSFIDSPEEVALRTREEGIKRLTGFMRTVCPLARLGNMRGFYAHPAALWK